MPIVCIGLSHHTAPVEVRERHAFPPSKMGEALVALRDYEAVREALMLSTCNRLEIYAELRLRSGDHADQAISAELPARRRQRHGIVPVHAPGDAGRRSPLPREYRARFDVDRRSGDPRAGQGRVHSGTKSRLAREDPAQSLPRSAGGRKDGTLAYLDR